MNYKKPIEKTRDSGVELLRIILMFQVIFLHICDYGGFSAINLELGGVHEFIYWVHQIFSRCPVYIFILISGYFSVTSKSTMKSIWPKAKNIYLSAIFYSLGVTFFLLILGTADIGKKDIVKSFLPFTSRTWYFISVYLIVLVLSPVVNLALTRLSKKDYRILLAVLFFMFSIWQVVATIEPVNKIISVNSVIETTRGRGLYGFLFMYIIGGYIRLHVKQEEKPAWKYLAASFGFVFLDVILVYALKGIPILENYASVVTLNNAPFAIMQAVCLLLFFKTVHFKSKFINKLSSHNLGVYMLHEHWLMRRVIWNKVFLATQNTAFYSSPFYLVKVYTIIFIIYVAGILLDMTRAFIFSVIEKIYKRIKNHNIKT